MRVAHLLPSMATGGRERIVADCCAAAGRWGVEPLVVSYDPGEAGARLPVAAPVLVVDRREPGFAAALAAVLRRERIDLVHTQGHVPAALAAPLASEWPVVATLHVALGGGWRWLPQVARGLRRAAAVTAVSDDLATRFRWLAGQEVAVIAPGIDLARFAPQPRRRQGPFTVGIAARLHPVKRHIDALAAVRRLRAEGVACRLRIAGEGPLAAELRRLAEGLDVTFDGGVSDMPAWLASLNAFLLPSDHEGTPLALLEACASGLPCVATDVGGVAAALDGAGLLVPRRRPEAIAAALRRLATEPELAAGLARAAEERSRAFALDRSHAAYADLYRGVLSPVQSALRAPAGAA